MVGPPGRWSAPSVTEPEETAVDVASWLRNLGLERYEATFRENDVGAEDLCHLTAEDLKDIGVAAIGHRRRLLVAIAKLREDSAPQMAGANQSSAGINIHGRTPPADRDVLRPGGFDGAE